MNLAELKTLPSNIHAEKALIASIMDNNDILYDLDVRSSMMVWREEREIMKTIELIAKETKVIDISLVHWRLKDDCKEYFFDLLLCDHIYTRAKQYQVEIIEKYTQRNLIKLWSDITNLAFDYWNIDQIKSITSKIMMEWFKDDQVSFLEQFYETVDSLGKRWDIIARFGYDKLDVLKWYVEWNLIVVWARPKVWKSTFVINLMRRVSEQWIKTALFSLEMNRTEISERFISMLASVSSFRLDHLTDLEKAEVSKQTNKYVEIIQRMEVIDNVSSAEKIYMNIRKLWGEWYKVIYIDYLQLISWEWSNANERISKITTALKRLASELWICIVILSQLNRDGAKWTPELHNLRDSWSIEQDANMVMFLEYKQDAPRILEVNVAANRSWPTINCDLSYIREFYFITD